ncbi:hypothetical protein RMQ97_09095 [Maricaulis sp. D1M11]|uniref:hypothetical protein n=1 Tax=Maricaulis sp. D1M11 TaxID=3076117 RepID=UPI0039B5B36A
MSERLDTEAWVSRACDIMNADLPQGATRINGDTPINQTYVRQVADLESLLERIDPEASVDKDFFPALAHMKPSEGWPLDFILGGGAAFAVAVFVPNWLGLTHLFLWAVIAAAIFVHYSIVQQRKARAKHYIRKLGLDPTKEYVLTLRMLAQYRLGNQTVH